MTILKVKNLGIIYSARISGDQLPTGACLWLPCQTWSETQNLLVEKWQQHSASTPCYLWGLHGRFTHGICSCLLATFQMKSVSLFSLEDLPNIGWKVGHKSNTALKSSPQAKHSHSFPKVFFSGSLVYQYLITFKNMV